MPSKKEIERLENDLLAKFSDHLCKLVALYGIAETSGMDDLANRATDNIQDAYHGYGTVFSPGLAHAVFRQTKKGSKLRDLCVGSIILHVSTY